MDEHSGGRPAPEGDETGDLEGSEEHDMAGAEAQGDGPPPPPGGSQEPPAPPPPPPSPPGRGSWHLRRSVHDRRVKGVAAGLAAAADVDPVMVRLLFAVAALSGWGIVVYIVLAIVLPDEAPAAPARPLPWDQRRLLRVVMVIGAAVAIGRLLDGPFIGGGFGGAFPFLLIAAGAAVLWARRDGQRSPEPAGAWAGPAPSPGASDQGWSGGPQPGWTGSADPDRPSWPTAPGPRTRPAIDWRATGRDLLRLGGAFAAVAAFIALLVGLLFVGFGAVSMRLPFLPAALGVVALVGLVLAVVRSTRPAGVLVSVSALALAAALALGLTSLPGGAGTRTVVVGPGTPLLDRYEHGAGRLLLDLRELTVPSGSTRQVRAELGTGQLSVLVPKTLTTAVRAGVGAGNVTLFRVHEAGVAIETSGARDAGPESGHLELDLEVGIGGIRVAPAPDPTFEVECQVPADAKGDGSDLITCAHPRALAATPMVCAVVLADPAGYGQGGWGFCRQEGADVPPTPGEFSTVCTVPGESDTATCRPLGPFQLRQLQAMRLSQSQPTATTIHAGPELTCGPPDESGSRVCTPGPAPSSFTTIAPAFRCTQLEGSNELTCVPG